MSLMKIQEKLLFRKRELTLIILALDTCSTAGSVTLLENKTLLAQQTLNIKRTHSETLLPTISHLFEQTKRTIDDIDLLAVSKGPGSFTGVRIGLSVVKGLAFQKEIPCMGISTLEALAYQSIDLEGIVVPLLDARKSQFYTATFRVKDKQVTRLTDDKATQVETITEELEAYKEPIFLVGDGASLCYTKVKENEFTHLPSSLFTVNSSWGVAQAALATYKSEKAVAADQLTPEYLRLSQAQVQLLERQEKENQK